MLKQFLLCRLGSVALNSYHGLDSLGLGELSNVGMIYTKGLQGG